MSHIIFCNTYKKDSFGSLRIIYAIIGIAANGLIVRDRHIFTVGTYVDTWAYFTTAMVIIVILTGMKISSGLSHR